MTTAHAGTLWQHIQKLVVAHGVPPGTDRQLLDDFSVHRDEAAFALLVARHGPMVLRVCRRVLHHEQDAEDAFQATFLVLARQAGSIRQRETVANWLHGVAYRTAMKAKRSTARRRNQEGQLRSLPARTAASPRWEDVQAVLDQEIERLPDLYRSAFVLCVLEGKSGSEAAAALGIKEGTVSSRLTRARQRLQRQLARRGIKLAALLAALAVAEGAGEAGVPGLLSQATIRFGLLVAAGEPAAGAIPAHVAALAAGVIRAMVLTKAKVATMILLAGAVFAGAALGVHQAIPAKNPDQPQAGSSQPGNPESAPGKSPAAPAQSKRADTLPCRGRVLGPDGKPAAGAKLLLLGKGKDPVDLGTSAADGQFTVEVPTGREGYALVVRVDRIGIDFIDLGRINPTASLELRMVPDQVIRGRIVDTQGKPAVGVRVTVNHLGIYADDSLDPFLAEWKKRDFQSGLPSGMKHLGREEGSFLRATTNADGRFAIVGAGAERLVSLRVEGAGIAETEAWVVNRAGFDPKPYNEATANKIPKGYGRIGFNPLLYGPGLALVVEAEKPIRGVVTAADTGKGRPGVEVSLTRNGSELVSILLKAKTDAQGRYEIHGVHKAQAYMLEIPGDPAAGYMACQVRAADTPGYQPVTADIRVARGVIITGRVIDRSTGKPVPGFALANVLSGNPFAKEYPEFNSSAWLGSQQTKDDGTFRIVTIPGPVLLMGGPDLRRLPGGYAESMKYKPVVPDPTYPQYFSKRPDHVAYYTLRGGINILQGNFCKVLEIKPGTALVQQDIVLEQASTLPVRILNVEGRPLTGTWVTGIGPGDWHRPIRIETDSCSAYDVEAGKPRLMVFYEPGKKLAGALSLKGDEQGPVAVKLQPSGAVDGQLQAADGKPLAGVIVEVSYNDREAQEIHDHVHRAKEIVTDRNGAFRIDELIPGLTFTLHYRGPKRTFERSEKILPKAIAVKPSEPLDLGVIKLPPAPEADGE